MTPSDNDSRFAPIGDYAIIGNCHTAALVGLNGSIDWYCPDKFDGPSVFCRILDADKGGCCRISPAGHFKSQRRYIENTNILQTTFIAGDSKARLTDFMPLTEQPGSQQGSESNINVPQKVVRLVEGIAGQIEFELIFQPAFNYARGNTTIRCEPERGIIARGGNQRLLLGSSNSQLEIHSEGNNRWRSRFRVSANDRYWFILISNNIKAQVSEILCDKELNATRLFWEEWAKQCTYNGPYRDHVLRSALTLKLLTYGPTGAIIAAPTTSLPEEIGGIRNWDYRYSWLRDSALILYALLNIGYHESARDFFEWLQRTHSQDPKQNLQILYGINGRRNVPEKVLSHLEGYRKSIPVRIGNAASKQKQLDTFGEVLTAAYLYFKSGLGKREKGSRDLSNERILKNEWDLLKELINTTGRQWEESDNGIWEVRGGRQQYLYSKIMCWAALDRGIRLATEFHLSAPFSEWKAARAQIKKTILTSGFNKELGAFVQVLGDSDLDASVLLIPRVGLLPVTDYRMQSTIKQIQNGLMQNGLLYRYRAEDGLPGSEGTFITCTFWLVEALALSGKLKEAHSLFEHILGYCNDVGLLSEEIDPDKKEFLGNFPQGFSHVALINAAVNLAKAMKHGPEHKPETEYQRAKKAGPAASQGYSKP